MKVYDYEDLVKGENYFFVYAGVVYYGEASNEDLDKYTEPTYFYVEDDQFASSDNYYGKIKVCHVWDAKLIYTLEGG